MRRERIPADRFSGTVELNGLHSVPLFDGVSPKEAFPPKSCHSLNLGGIYLD